MKMKLKMTAVSEGSELRGLRNAPGCSGCSMFLVLSRALGKKKKTTFSLTFQVWPQLG